MINELAELFALEKSGQYQEALTRIYTEVCGTAEISPVRRLNLRLLEQRLRVRLGLQGVSILPNVSLQSTATESTWSAIITLWKRRSYLEEQLAAIRGQSMIPREIIIILNEKHMSESDVRDIAGPNVKIICSDINSLYSRWALAYIAEGDYVAVFDDDVIPGEYWIDNAIRACRCYNALVGSQGRIFNRKGKHEFFKIVTPDVDAKDENIISCSETDIFCDWVCNSYLFKREWVGNILGQVRYRDSYKTFDDIQLSVSLFINGGIRCITPMQPVYEKRLHGSLRREYGSDAYAIWKTNSEKHFSERKSYIESLIQNGYIPVQQRDNLFIFHLIVPFGEKSHLERCLLSIKGQTYQNFTCTLIDDCRNENNALDLVRRLRLDSSRFRYIKTIQKVGPLRAREMATDMLAANPADVIVHLDGDDWFACPDVLGRLNRIYRRGGVLASYGNALCLRNHERRDFQEYSHYDMSKKWNVAQKDVDADVFPFRRIELPEVSEGWGDAPWCGMHLRTFQFVKWIGLNRKTFQDMRGEYLRVATDAAVMIPILDSCRFDSVVFVPDIGYIYQNAHNTIHAKNEISAQEKIDALAVIARADSTLNHQAVCQVLREGASPVSVSDAKVLMDTLHAAQEKCAVRRDMGNCPPVKNLSREKCSIVTIVTPDFLGDAVLCLLSYKRNLNVDCRAYVFVATSDADVASTCARMLESSGLEPLFPTTLQYTASQSRALEQKYALASDQYRWGMKAVVLLELLHGSSTCALFLDSDTYTVSDITDVHQIIMRQPISVFPHFRDPDHEKQRGVLYKDGFFNGGMLAATTVGIPHLIRLYERCLREMTKDPSRNLWDDQKYYDFFELEVERLYVNFDKGINYNYWNHELIEGLVSPSQRSLLLKCGSFSRHFHMSTMLIKGSIELKEKKFLVYRPIVSIYMLSLLYTLVLLMMQIKKKGLRLGHDPLGLISRYNIVEKKLIKLSVHIPVGHIKNILNLILKNNTVDFNNILHQWTESLLKSICFDNFEVFTDMLASFFPDNGTAADMKSRIRRRDLRYIADEVVGSPDLCREEMKDLLEEEGAGMLIKKQLSVLKSCNIAY